MEYRRTLRIGDTEEEHMIEGDIHDVLSVIERTHEVRCVYCGKTHIVKTHTYQPLKESKFDFTQRGV